MLEVLALALGVVGMVNGLFAVLLAVGLAYATESEAQEVPWFGPTILALLTAFAVCMTAALLLDKIASRLHSPSPTLPVPEEPDR